MNDTQVPKGALERILRDGLRPRVTTWSRLRELWSVVGVGNVFLGTGTRVFVAVGVAASAVALVSASGGSLGLLFALAPLMFLSLTGFVEGAERWGPLADLRGTLRYSGHQLAAFRILVFGVAGLIFGIVLSVSMALAGMAPALGDAVMISAIAVSASAVLALAALRRFSSRWLAVPLPLIWTFAWMVPLVVWGEAWEALLAGIPGVIGWGLSVVALLVFARQVRGVMQGRGFAGEGMIHAVG